MAKLALHGPMYSGKTTLSRALVARHGYEWIDYTSELKKMAARSLSAVGYETTLEDIQVYKPKYRAYLQELGVLTGFDDGTIIPDMLAALRADDDSLPADMVFDNVRTPQQWAMLKLVGFTLVRLQVDTLTQQRRGTVTASGHAIEQPLACEPGEILLNTAQDTHDIIYHLGMELNARGLAL